jgi:hypothetical protein
MYIFTDKLFAFIPQQDTGQQTSFAEDLEAIAYPEYKTTPGSKICYRLHDGRKPGDSPCPQVIAEGKSSRQDDTIAQSEACQIRIFVPKAHGVLSEYRTQNVHHVVVAI